LKFFEKENTKNYYVNLTLNSSRASANTFSPAALRDQGLPEELELGLPSRRRFWASVP
jgi:hypothetical protein